jgi:hypothetical protein
VEEEMDEIKQKENRKAFISSFVMENDDISEGNAPMELDGVGPQHNQQEIDLLQRSFQSGFAIGDNVLSAINEEDQSGYNSFVCTTNGGGTSTAPRQFAFNFQFSRRLNTLLYREHEIKYQLAYLSTLGGAYHLCNDPSKAMMIAQKQQQIGQLLGSSVIIIRSKVFQAVNLGMQGKEKTCKKKLQNCKDVAEANMWTNMLEFVNTSESWLKTNNYIT